MYPRGSTKLHEGESKASCFFVSFVDTLFLGIAYNFGILTALLRRSCILASIALG